MSSCIHIAYGFPFGKKPNLSHFTLKLSGMKYARNIHTHSHRQTHSPSQYTLTIHSHTSIDDTIHSNALIDIIQHTYRIFYRLFLPSHAQIVSR